MPLTLSTLPLEVRPQYLPVVLRLEFFRPPEDVACRGLTAGLRFDPATHWWGGLSVPINLGTTVEFYYKPLSLDSLTVMS